MRRMVSVLGGTEGLELLLARLIKTKTNVEFLATLTKDIPIRVTGKHKRSCAHSSFCV